MQDQYAGVLPVLETLTQTAHRFRLPVDEDRRVAGGWLDYDQELQLAGV